MRAPAWADGACIAAGGVLFLAFSPWDLALVAVASLAVLFRALLRATPRRAFWRGWLFGAAGFGAGIWWIAESFQYRDLGVVPAAALTGLLVAVLALWPALFAWASARFLGGTGSQPESGAVSAAAFWWLPGTWILVEWLRGTLFSGFTWLQVGYAGLESPLSAWAPLGGSYAVGLALAVTAASFAMVGAARPRAVVYAFGVSALLWAGGAAMDALDTHARWTRPAGAHVRALIVQGNVPQEEKWSEPARRAALDRYARLTAERPGADFVVWPETAIPYFAAEARSWLRTAGAAAERGGYVLLTGILSFDPASGNPYNSVVRISSPRSADTPSYYHKRHLVPFGERIPFPAALAPVARWLGFPSKSFASGGEEQVPLRVAGHEVAVSICYEITFGAESARGLGDARLLVNVSNDAWFGDTAGPHQHFQMARMRALEQGRWLVRATNTGLSALVTPEGGVAGSIPPFETAGLTVAFPPLEGRTPYARWRDRPVLVLLALLLVIGWRIRWWGGGGRISPGLELRSDEAPVRHVQEVGRLSYQVLLVLVETAVRERHPPQHLDDLRLLFRGELLVQPARKLVERDRFLHRPLGPDEQLLGRAGVESVCGPEHPADRGSFGGIDLEVRARDLDEQGGDREPTRRNVAAGSLLGPISESLQHRRPQTRRNTAKDDKIIY